MFRSFCVENHEELIQFIINSLLDDIDKFVASNSLREAINKNRCIR